MAGLSLANQGQALSPDAAVPGPVDRALRRRCNRYDQDYIKQAVCNTQALNLAYRKAQHFAREAARSLDGVTPETRRMALLGLVDQVLQRHR
jgi:geranylgeranyl pyrophosphate synthase